MTSDVFDDVDSWLVIYGVIEDPELESGIHAAQTMILRLKSTKWININKQTGLQYSKKTAPLKCDLHDLDLETTVYGVYASINTNKCG